MEWVKPVNSIKGSDQAGFLGKEKMYEIEMEKTSHLLKIQNQTHKLPVSK
jgi:hypothetical protein